jgi:hypothetical protein
MLSTGSGRNKVRLAARTLGLVALVGLVVGCRSDASTPRGAAELFLDAHYVEIDLPAARELTAGVARHKVEEEMRLVEGQPIDEGTRKPVVHYRLLEEHPEGGDAVRYLYRGRITVEDAGRFERSWMVTVRRDGGGWRVTNYQELDG